MKISDLNKSNKWDDCKDCIYFQEVEEEMQSKYNSSIDVAFELNKFITECNYCKEITKC